MGLTRFTPHFTFSQLVSTPWPFPIHVFSWRPVGALLHFSPPREYLSLCRTAFCTSSNRIRIDTRLWSVLTAVKKRKKYAASSRVWHKWGILRRCVHWMGNKISVQNLQEVVCWILYVPATNWSTGYFWIKISNFSCKVSIWDDNFWYLGTISKVDLKGCCDHQSLPPDIVIR